MSASISVLREAAGNRGIRSLQLASATWGAAEAAYLVGLLVHAYSTGGSGAVAVVAVIRALPSVVLAPLRVVRTLGPLDSFGEIALLRDVPRTATVRALEDRVVASVGRGHFLSAVSSHRESADAAEDVIRSRLGD